jgi:release factor glutamine methyltransferase
VLIRDLLAAAGERLRAAGSDTPRLDAELLLAHALGVDVDRTWLYVHALEPAPAEQFERLLQRREDRCPVAYITGEKEFFALPFEVNRHVLIPRPETELLVETALRSPSAHRRSPIILDVGTGSGCVAVALAKHLQSSFVVAIDTSVDALGVARRNAARHQLLSQVAFVQGDLLGPIAGPVDLIVSNPPYLSRTELQATAPEVQAYEPTLALDGGPDGLAVIRRLLAQAASRLTAGSTLLVEIGAKQGAAALCLAQAHFPQAAIAIKPDLAGRDRVLVVEVQ